MTCKGQGYGVVAKGCGSRTLGLLSSGAIASSPLCPRRVTPLEERVDR
jgi:hypothetical protein